MDPTQKPFHKFKSHCLKLLYIYTDKHIVFELLTLSEMKTIYRWAIITAKNWHFGCISVQPTRNEGKVFNQLMTKVSLRNVECRACTTNYRYSYISTGTATKSDLVAEPKYYTRPRVLITKTSRI